MEGGPSVALISDGLWAERYGRSRDVLGRTLQLSGTTVEIVGVMPAGFAFPNPGVRLWTPLRVDPAGTDFGGFNHPAIARLRDGDASQQEFAVRLLWRCGGDAAAGALEPAGVPRALHP